MTAIDFVRASEAALRDRRLQDALHTAMVRFREQERAGQAEVADWQELREQARAVKEHTLAHLGHYLVQLESQLTAAGGQVHWARTADEAVRVVAEIALGSGRRVVKSKSMTTEEIHLNAALERAGMSVTETDLGEYLIQLAGETPSHIVGPAIHKSVPAIADLLTANLGIPRTEAPHELTAAVRRVLRERFLEADVGISGVNFAVAETGTLVIVENEGNARLATSQPRVHIAVMGIEKVLPRLADLAVFLTLLPRAATGQRMSSYVSLLTGPRRRGERDGPEALHLVILDGGRSAIHADPVMRQALRCIRCGACLNVCPVFERTGGHAYGSVYSGPIGAVLTPLFRGMEEAGALPFASSLCGACGEICPVKIDLPGLLLELRARAVASGLAAIGETLFVKGWTAAALRAGRFALAGRMMRTALRWIGRRPGWVPYPMSKWMASRDLPASPRAAFRDRPQP
jgi:L-lactate dehydrogenase complex protein LldF